MDAPPERIPTNTLRTNRNCLSERRFLVFQNQWVRRLILDIKRSIEPEQINLVCSLNSKKVRFWVLSGFGGCLIKQGAKKNPGI
jgi:hypothetical protein